MAWSNDCTKALAINPACLEAFLLRGKALALTSKFDEAISDYSKAIQINPGVAAAYGGRGYARAKKGEFERRSEI